MGDEYKAEAGEQAGFCSPPRCSPPSPLIHSFDSLGRGQRCRELNHPPECLGHLLVHTRPLSCSIFLSHPSLHTYLPPCDRCFRLGFLEAELETDFCSVIYYWRALRRC